MIRNFTMALLLAVPMSPLGAPADREESVTFPDSGSPLAASAYTEDLRDAGLTNGELSADLLIELESSPGCLVEEEAAEAWAALERQAAVDGIEFIARWCYRDLASQRRTYGRNCPLVVVSVDPAPPGDGLAGQPSSTGDPAPAGSGDEGASSEPSPPPATARTRVCRVPTATPGNSNHGWGRAVDITASGKLLSCESVAFHWLTENADSYGWVHPPWAACGAAKEEAWHWEWGATREPEPPVAVRGWIAS